ncbi:MAG: TetR/AcrR family transcriptional regulator [Rhodococcus sp. (in: high G+C Gram-positive bacteria)]|uniref:TetR/AcrR family transcriptional regulator n=1 Tax=Rhodococcus sp. TaxID=1831 RepID=UPI003BB49201
MPPSSRSTPETTDAAHDTLLNAVEVLFYERGYQAVGMDEIREASGLSLKRIYALYPGKEALAVAMLDRRDHRWNAELANYVDRYTEPDRRLLAVFDWLSVWLSGAGHRGCAWTNAYGELGGTSEAIADAARRHKARLRDYLSDLTDDAGASSTTADAAYLLAEGCMVAAGITGSPEPATRARRVVQQLLG